MFNGANRVSGLGYGTQTGGASYTEGTAAVVPAANNSIGRSPNGGDTGKNSVDFKTYATPSPGAVNP